MIQRERCNSRRDVKTPSSFFKVVAVAFLSIWPVGLNDLKHLSLRSTVWQTVPSCWNLLCFVFAISPPTLLMIQSPTNLMVLMALLDWALALVMLMLQTDKIFLDGASYINVLGKRKESPKDEEFRLHCPDSYWSRKLLEIDDRFWTYVWDGSLKKTKIRQGQPSSTHS